MARNQKSKSEISYIIVDEYYDISNEYYHWLCDFVDINNSRRSYFLLMQTLHHKQFLWSIPNDDSRANDGIMLRNRFVEDMKYGTDGLKLLERPCSMLEMLIALAQRMDQIMDELDNVDKTAKWFWVLLKNIGLDKFTDERYYDLGGELKILSVLNDVLERNYKKNGQGGLFPLKKPAKDQRKVEIWYQMSAYILENYYVK